MSTDFPAPPGALGQAASPQQVLGWLGALDGWLAARRSELDGLDAAVLRRQEPESFTADLSLAMALWQSVKSGQQALLQVWDSGRVGPAELDRISTLTWGRLDTSATGLAQLQSMPLSLPEAGRLSDALAAQLRTRLQTTPEAAGMATRLTQLRAQAERIRDQIATEPPAAAGPARARLDALNHRLSDLAEKQERGGDIAGFFSVLEADYTVFERDLIVQGAQRRQAVDLLGQVRARHAAVVAGHSRLLALARTVSETIAGPPIPQPEDPQTLGPIPNTPEALGGYAASLARFEAVQVQAEQQLLAAKAQLDARRAQLPALQTKATQLGFGSDPALAELAELITRWLERLPVPLPVIDDLLQAYSNQLQLLESNRHEM